MNYNSRSIWRAWVIRAWDYQVAFSLDAKTQDEAAAIATAMAGNGELERRLAKVFEGRRAHHEEEDEGALPRVRCLRGPGRHRLLPRGGQRQAFRQMLYEEISDYIDSRPFGAEAEADEAGPPH